MFAIVHLPLYSGNTLTLYRYVPAPFFLDDSKVALEIHSKFEYLALDTHGMMGKQMTASEFQLCRKVGNIYHCPHMNLLNKNLESLCLYNLYSQSTTQIEKTCKVDISMLQSHAVQISTSLYRIITIKPLQLVRDCKTGSNVTTIQGVYMLTLTSDCPKASTPEHLFIRTPELLLGSQELITLPLLSRSKEWLGEVDREVDFSQILTSMTSMPVPPTSIPLQKFRQYLTHRHYNTYQSIEHYIIVSVAYSTIIIVLVMAAKVGVTWVVGKRKPRAKSLPVRRAGIEFSDSDGELISRPFVNLPPVIRRQYEVR